MTIPPTAKKAGKAALWMGAPAAVTTMLAALAGISEAGPVALALAVVLAGALLATGTVAIYLVRSVNKAVHAPTNEPMARINGFVDACRRTHPEPPARRSPTTPRSRDAPRLPRPRRDDEDRSATGAPRPTRGSDPMAR